MRKDVHVLVFGRQTRSIIDCSKFIGWTTLQISETSLNNKKKTIPILTEPGIRTSKCPLLACNIRCRCYMKNSLNSVKIYGQACSTNKVKFGIEVVSSANKVKFGIEVVSGKQGQVRYRGRERQTRSSSVSRSRAANKVKFGIEVVSSANKVKFGIEVVSSANKVKFGIEVVSSANKVKFGIEVVNGKQGQVRYRGRELV